MNRVFIISDTHFGHKKICGFEPKERPFASVEEHDTELVKRWNSVVGRHDTVWHLGDVLFGKENFETLEQLNGIKNLVMGNHDRYRIDLYAQHFNWIVGAAELRGAILTHIPGHTSRNRRLDITPSH